MFFVKLFITAGLIMGFVMTEEFYDNRKEKYNVQACINVWALLYALMIILIWTLF